jgi:hypothetical protein
MSRLMERLAHTRRCSGLRSRVRFCFTDPNAFSTLAAEALAARIMAHPLVGRSQLIGTFEGSRGFGIALTSANKSALRERFPFFSEPLAHFERCPVHMLPRSRLFSFSDRRLPNAYYMNVLVVEDGQGVGRHIDGTLGGAVDAPGLTPAVVSVLYLRVPSRREGGQLSLFNDDHCVATIAPQAGMVVHFRGSLAHEVSPLEGANGPRISLVCEQYVLTDEQLARMPPFVVQSRASDPLFKRGEKRAFSDYLS